MKNKILVSWVATNNDFLQKNKTGEMRYVEGGINKEGPHFSIFRHFPEYKTHYLLTQHTLDSIPASVEKLASELRKEFNITLELIPMNIFDVVSVEEIKNKVSILLKRFSNKEIDILVYTGTPSMTVAWYLLALEHENMHLINLRPAKHSKSGKHEVEPIEFNSSKFAHTIQVIDQQRKKSNTIIETPTIKKIYSEAEIFASTSTHTILIHGATGTGKEKLAEHIHTSSKRKGDFIAINCGAFTQELLESRLFGYVKGAFTGAEKDTKGLFTLADKGTLFLDEIGEISQYMQVLLLRVLQEKTIRPVGSDKEIKVDVRIVTASHKDLWKMCLDGKFRYDLFYRLAILEISLPSFIELPIDERKYLMSELIKLKNPYKTKPILKLENNVWDILLSHAFPGNIRELENLIERLYCTCTDLVTKKDIPQRILNLDAQFSNKLDDIVNQHYLKMYDVCDGNVTKISEVLDVSRGTATTKLKELGKIKTTREV